MHIVTGTAETPSSLVDRGSSIGYLGNDEKAEKSVHFLCRDADFNVFAGRFVYEYPEIYQIDEIFL